MQEKRSVDCAGETTEYIFTRKNVKNINMRIRSDGSISVSAPRKVSVKTVDDFVRSRYDFIKSALERLSRNKNDEPDENRIFEDGDKISFLGKKLTVKIVCGETDSVKVCEDELVVQTYDTENEAYINKLIRDFYYNSTVALFRELNNEISALFKEKFGVEKAPVKLRRMRSRWGSCHVYDKTIVMNTRLIFYPRQSSRYVFIHEYAHFIEPNHSSRFYDIVRSVMPDYKIYSDMLK